MADSMPVRKISKKKIRKNSLLYNLLYNNIVRQLVIYAVSLSVVIGTFYIAGSIIYKKVFLPVDANDKTFVEVEVPMGTSVSGIAEILYNKGLISNIGAFKILVDLSNKSNKMQSGKYRLSKSMTMQEMIDELLTGKVAVNAVSITIREGDNIKKIADRLVNEFKLSFSEEEFIKAAKNVEGFAKEFDFLKKIPKDRLKMDYPLEGYLFPDTYYVYADDKPDDVIRVMLAEFQRVYDPEMIEKTEKLGMTMDEVVNLASIVQNEGIDEEFSKIAAVFHNRLKINMPLQSCATIGYFRERKVDQTNITNEDINTPSPYNTYLNKGLPIGPISSPGKNAIMAVLEPYKEFMDEDKPMLYFVLMDPKEGKHAFNTNAEDHAKDKAKYQHLWN